MKQNRNDGGDEMKQNRNDGGDEMKQNQNNGGDEMKQNRIQVWSYDPWLNKNVLIWVWVEQ